MTGVILDVIRLEVNRMENLIHVFVKKSKNRIVKHYHLCILAKYKIKPSKIIWK